MAVQSIGYLACHHQHCLRSGDRPASRYSSWSSDLVIRRDTQCRNYCHSLDYMYTCMIYDSYAINGLKATILTPSYLPRCDKLKPPIRNRNKVEATTHSWVKDLMKTFFAKRWRKQTLKALRSNTFATTKRIRQNPLWLWNPEETSPEIEKQGYQWPQNRTYKCVHPKKSLKKKPLTAQVLTSRSNKHAPLKENNGKNVKIARVNGSLKPRAQLLWKLDSATAEHRCECYWGSASWQGVLQVYMATGQLVVMIRETWWGWDM